MPENEKVTVVLDEQIIEGKETAEVGIDMSAENEISKDEFKVKTKELYDKLAGLPKRTDIDDASKKKLADQYTQEIKALLKPFFAIGLREVTNLRKKETQNMEQLLAIYKLLAKYFDGKDKLTGEELDKMAEEIRLLNEFDSKNTKQTFFNDIDKVLSDADGEFVKSLSSVTRGLEQKIITYSLPVFDVELILNGITPVTLKEKARILTDNRLFNFKKAKLATFLKKKINDKEWHKQFKKDADYVFVVVNLCRDAIRRAITVDDIAESYLAEGQTREEYLETFKAQGSKELDNLALVTAMFVIDFVFDAFADNAAKPVDRHMYLGILYNRANYDMMREVVAKFVYTIGDMVF